MEKITRAIEITALTKEAPYVRVSGYFLEGGTSTTSQQATAVSFLASGLPPLIDQRLVMTIEERSS